MQETLHLDPYRSLPHPGETAMIEVRPEVLVVGAGISGLTAARILAERGYPVTVLDKGRRLPGGRSSTRYDGDYAFDHGCQYFTARDPRFRLYVEAWMELGIVSVWSARRASLQQGVVSPVADDVVRYVGVPGMNALARHLAKGLDVRQNVVVTDLHHQDGLWTVDANGPVPEAFEVVLAAVPPKTAVDLIPQQVPISLSAASVDMQPCWTAMVVFDYDLDLAFDAAHISGSPLIWAANNGSKPGRSGVEGWVFQASPSWSADHLQDAPDDVANQLLAAFFEAVGVTPVTPRYLASHRWQSASPALPLQKGCLWDDEVGIGACGDWCHSSRLEGAFLSGLELAGRVLNDRPRSMQVHHT